VGKLLNTAPPAFFSAVIGLPDPKSGEIVKAFIQLKPGHQATEQEILDFYKEKMAGYKWPRIVEFGSQIPTSMVGKVLRRVLREEKLKKLSR
jgi:long-chain acyl-CoA synthetase